MFKKGHVKLYWIKKGVGVMREKQVKGCLIGTYLSESEYENLKRCVKERKQSISEIGVMGLAILLKKEDAVIDKRKKVVNMKAVNFRVSDFLGSELKAYAEKKGVSQSAVLARAFQEVVGD